jgi:hypothetical protein
LAGGTAFHNAPLEAEVGGILTKMTGEKNGKGIFCHSGI